MFRHCAPLWETPLRTIPLCPISQNELAYKCNTCQADPTCAICVECFNKGDHTGHDYRMIRTVGGMCDCGDASGVLSVLSVQSRP